MFPSRFDYYQPKTLQEAVDLLAQSGGEAKVLAGGHSLLPLMKLRLAQPKYLVDIARVPGLVGISQQDGTVVIRAMTTHHDLETSQVLHTRVPIISEAAGLIGDLQVRNRGTIGGSLAHADPAADLPAVALALAAQMKAVGPQGERVIGADDFFVDIMTTALQPDEVLTEVSVPAFAPRTGGAYLKFPNPASRYAIVGVAAVVSLDANDHVQAIRVGITGLAGKPFRATRVEQELMGRKATAEVIAEAAQWAPDGVEPLSDIHASARYRAHLAGVFARRAIAAAVERARLA